MSPQDRANAWPALLGRLAGAGVSLLVSVLLVRYMVKELDPMKKEKEKGKEVREKLQKRLQVLRPGVSLGSNPYEDMVCPDVIDPTDIDVGFDDIGGLEGLKEELGELVILPISHPELFQAVALGVPKGILLYGPPGTGKTMVAKAIARESGAVFINVDLSTILNKWYGESQKIIRAIFNLANKLEPAVIFVDEIDALLSERRSSEHEASATTKSAFLTLWDGLFTRQDSRVIVLGATNRPWELDPAILRRLPRSFFVDLPEWESRKDILLTILRKLTTEEDIDVEMVATATEGYSGSDLKELVKAATLLPVREAVGRARAAASSAGGGGDGARGIFSSGSRGPSRSATPLTQLQIDPSEVRPLSTQDLMSALGSVQASRKAQDARKFALFKSTVAGAR
eukprot:tig00000989_g6084.t1